MINGEKIGVGVITCGRNELFKKCILSLNACKDIDNLYVYEDTLKDRMDFNETLGYSGDVMSKCSLNWSGSGSTKNVGVAKSKNYALKHLLDNGCDHIFIIEDDMLIKDPNIFQKYIETSKKTGIQHLMFGYHGPANKKGISGGSPAPRVVINYGDDTSLALNEHCVGAFCYYSRKSLENCGLIDERFGNAFDHVSHSYELSLKGYSTPYWWWADVANSTDYIEEQVCSEHSSSIKTPETMEKWKNNIYKSMELFKEKYGVLPFGNGGVKDTPESDVFKFLKSKKNED